METIEAAIREKISDLFDQRKENQLKARERALNRIEELGGKNVKIFCDSIAAQAELWNQQRCMLITLAASDKLNDSVFDAAARMVEQTDKEFSKIQLSTAAAVIHELVRNQLKECEIFRILTDLVSENRKIFGDFLTGGIDEAQKLKQARGGN